MEQDIESMFDEPLGEDPPPMPPCDHKYEYSIYFEKVKECHMVKRKCMECGNMEQKSVKLGENEDADDMDEDEIKLYFKK